jgi:hypothetical protein
MWEDEIVGEFHRIREEHAKAFDYDVKAICEDWRRRQEQSGHQYVTLTDEAEANKAIPQSVQKH